MMVPPIGAKTVRCVVTFPDCSICWICSGRIPQRRRRSRASAARSLVAAFEGVEQILLRDHQVGAVNLDEVITLSNLDAGKVSVNAVNAAGGPRCDVGDLSFGVIKFSDAAQFLEQFPIRNLLGLDTGALLQFCLGLRKLAHRD